MVKCFQLRPLIIDATRRSDPSATAGYLRGLIRRICQKQKALCLSQNKWEDYRE